MDEMGLSLPAGCGMAWVTPLPSSGGLPEPPDPEAVMGWMLCVLSLAVLPPGTHLWGEQEGEGLG